MQKSSPKIIAYLSLDSNIDDRLDYIDAAKEKLRAHPKIEITKESKVYETEPWPKDGDEHPHGERGQKWFLNQVIEIQTSLEPEELLEAAEAIEKDLGRTEKGSYQAREIDIDILLYNEEVIDLPHLQIPHRHLRDRQFVLEPLLELEPHLKDPATGEAYQKILETIEDTHEVIPFL